MSPPAPSDLLDRYLLLPPLGGIPVASGPVLTGFQRLALGAAAALAVVAVLVRAIAVEATARRFGVFFYVALGLLVLLLLSVVGNQSHAFVRAGGAP